MSALFLTAAAREQAGAGCEGLQVRWRGAKVQIILPGSRPSPSRPNQLQRLVPVPIPQCVRYSPGGAFDLHHDAGNGVPRAITVLYYLNGVVSAEPRKDCLRINSPASATNPRLSSRYAATPTLGWDVFPSRHGRRRPFDRPSSKQA